MHTSCCSKQWKFRKTKCISPCVIVTQKYRPHVNSCHITIINEHSYSQNLDTKHYLNFYRVIKDIAPKQEALKNAQQEVQEALEELQKQQMALKKIQDKLATLEADLLRSQEEKKGLCTLVIRLFIHFIGANLILCLTKSNICDQMIGLIYYKIS